MYIFIGMMKSDCRCSCALTSSAHGWKQQQQSTNQKPRRNHFERYLKGVHFPCDDATTVPFLIQKNIRFLFSIRHLLHLCFARLDFKSRATTTQKAKANGLVCCVQVPDCPVSLCPFLFFFVCALFLTLEASMTSAVSQIIIKKRKKKKKEKESRVMPSSWALWWDPTASRTRLQVMEQDGTGIYDTCGLEKKQNRIRHGRVRESQRTLID